MPSNQMLINYTEIPASWKAVAENNGIHVLEATDNETSKKVYMVPSQHYATLQAMVAGQGVEC